MSLFAHIRERTPGLADSIGRKKNGNYIFRRGFFYRHGIDAEKYRDIVVAALRAAHIQHTIADYGEHYVPTFRGGASVSQSSHWWVEVEINE